ncbi:Alpha/Beta hydrolase protein [Vararia minispora EC-137]|uniref:Alpha/Beta hydrolase protein n=1 Tax=Vararia minispora EC-137 TaxID=1314806 RepID=A0ACB8QKW4_9AGAM|nr:Alpha/Beta hydrolase protein [Vararia minispora EC-137]
MAQYAHLSIPDPDWTRISTLLPPDPPYSDDLDVVVAQVREIAKLSGPFNRSIYEPQLPSDELRPHVEDYTVTVDGGEIVVRVAIPRSSENETFPLLVYFHGGGFWAFDINFKDYMLRVLAHKLKIVTVNVGYRHRLLSLEQNKDAPFISKHYIELVCRFLGGDPSNPIMSPLLATSFAGLPRTLIQVAGLDPLRDEGILYGDLLYPGVPHSFEDVMYQTDKGQKYEKDVQDAIRWMTKAD